MLKINSVLIADDIEKECVDILHNAGIVVTVKTKQNKEQLMIELPKHDAVIVRSATKITRELITAASGKLKLIGRAGTGVDNIDVDAATEYGMIVMNTPAGNSRSACELTCTAILCLARHVPQAAASMREGKWARKDYMGEEVYGKTLAIIGLGRIGREVATRMQSFGMKTIGYDPIISAEEASKSGIQWMNLDDLFPLADYITVHVPLIKQTENLIGAKVFEKCKPTVKIINIARGGIVNEQELVEALNKGKAGGAAFDVFNEEPPKNRDLVDHPKIICTPHLGASTNEAQLRVAIEIAENIVALNNGIGLYGALNASAMEAVLSDEKAKWIRAVQALAQFLPAFSKNCKDIHLIYPKEMKQMEKALKTGVAIGILQGANDKITINLINAESQANKLGISVTTEAMSTYELTISSGAFSVSGYPSPTGTFISAINGSRVPVALLAVGTMVFTENGNSLALKETLKGNVLMECGLLNGGRVAVLSKMDSARLNEISKIGTVVHFSS